MMSLEGHSVGIVRRRLTSQSSEWGGYIYIVHKASKKSMQLAISHKIRTVKQPAVKKQCQSQLKREKNRRLKVIYCNADTFTQEKKHELQVLMAEDQPDIVAIPEVNPKGGPGATK